MSAISAGDMTLLPALLRCLTLPLLLPPRSMACLNRSCMACWLLLTRLVPPPRLLVVLDILKGFWRPTLSERVVSRLLSQEGREPELESSLTKK